MYVIPTNNTLLQQSWILLYWNLSNTLRTEVQVDLCDDVGVLSLSPGKGLTHYFAHNSELNLLNPQLTDQG